LHGSDALSLWATAARIISVTRFRPRAPRVDSYELDASVVDQ
jgi:hypothetical protein